MGKNMWQEMGPNNGAPRGGEGDRFWVSEKTEPVSFPPHSNNNQLKYQNSRAFQGNSPSPNDHPCIIFLLIRRITSTSSQEWGSKRASIPRGSLQQQLKNWSKTNTQAGIWMQWREKAWWEMPMWIVVLTPFTLLSQIYFFLQHQHLPKPNKTTFIKNKTAEGVWVNLPSNLFSTKNS